MAKRNLQEVTNPILKITLADGSVAHVDTVNAQIKDSKAFKWQLRELTLMEKELVRIIVSERAERSIELAA